MAPNNTDQPSTGDPGSLVPLGDNSASQDIVANARGRSDGFDMGSDRAIANPPNWNAQDSQQLYDSATVNNKPETATATAHAWTHHGTELKQASDHLYNAISELGNAWVGQGAAGAQGALVGIANSGSQASEAAHTMSDRLARQATAAEKVRHMPEPKQYDPKQSMAAALAGGPAALIADQKAQSDAADDVKAQQVAMFNAYTQAMSEVDSSTPSFGPESLGMKPTGSHNSVSFNPVGSVGSAGPVQALPGGGADAIFASGGAGFGGHGGALDAQHAGVGPNAAHGAAGFGHDAAVLGSDAPGGGPVAGAGTATGAGHVAPGGAPSGGNPLGKIGMGLGIGGAAGGLGALASRALGKGNRSGSKAENETSLASADGQAQSAASAQAPQQGVVSSAGTIGGQTPPPMNPGGMGGMAPQGAQPEQEEEHTHASFLIEADPDEAFGANQATPPPVIGAWSEDDEAR